MCFAFFLKSYQAEKAVNPQFSDFFASLYFGLTTLTTVYVSFIANVIVSI